MPNTGIDITLVNIMGREFKIKCPQDKVAELQKAAKYLNSKMQEVQHGDRSITIDRVAITAALNIAHELILEKSHLQATTSERSVCAEEFSHLRRKVGEFLADFS